MTLLSTTPKEINNGNGSTVSWDFSFKINKAADLKVITTDTDGVETVRTEGTGTTNYSVSVTSYPGTGSITYPATLGTKLATGEKITLERIVTIEQQTDLVNKGRYDPSQVEDALDLSRMVDLQLQSQIDRCLKIAASDNSGITVELPSETVRAGKVLGFDSAGNVSMMTIEGVKANYAATTAPTSGDDSADGYSVGSKWFDVTNDLTYECVDASAGAAVWVEIVGRTLTQLLTNKTVQGFKFADTSNDHQYTVTVSELAANRSILLPLLTGNDEFVFKDHAVTLTNKTFDLASNTLTGTTAQFNTALSDGSFATLAGTETLSSKTLASPVFTTQLTAVDNAKIILGTGSDFELLHNGTNNILNSVNGALAFQFAGTTMMTLNTYGFRIGDANAPGSGNPFGIKFSTEDLDFNDAGSTSATEQDWIQVKVGGNIGYIRVYATK